MITISIGKYDIGFEQGKIPVMFNYYKENALLYEEYTSKEYEGEDLVIIVGENGAKPSLVIKMKYWPNVGGFNPSILLVQAKDTLFIGAGQNVLA